MKLREILKVSALLFACHAFLPAGAQESGETVRTGPLLYGSVINANGWNWSNSVYGFYSIEPRENTSVDLVKEVNVMSSDNGIYADGKYYFTKAYENSGELSYLNSYVLQKKAAPILIILNGRIIRRLLVLTTPLPKKVMA